MPAELIPVRFTTISPYTLPMRIALAQINPTVGDLAGNVRKIIDFIARAKTAGAQLVVFSKTGAALTRRGEELARALQRFDQEIHALTSDLRAELGQAEGTVRMRWWSDDEGAYFSVIDSGIGIPAEHIPRLTERFYRVDAGRSRGQGGSGLGLAIVKHALQRHGGWLDVQSVEGKGSTFTCHFPQQRVWKLAMRAAASA